MKPDGVATATMEPVEAVEARTEAGEQPQQIAPEEVKKSEAETKPPAGKSKNSKPTDPKAKTKGPVKAKASAVTNASGKSSGTPPRPGTVQNRRVNGVQKQPTSNGVAEKPNTATSEKKKPTPTTALAKKPTAGSTPPKAADKKPVAAARPATAPGTVGTLPPNKKTPTTPTNSTKAKPKSPAPRPASAAPTKSGTTGVVKPDKPPASKTTSRPAAGSPASRPPAAASTGKPVQAKSASTVSSSASRATTAQAPKSTTPAKKDVGRPASTVAKKSSEPLSRPSPCKTSKTESPKPTPAAKSDSSTKRPPSSSKPADTKPTRPKSQDTKTASPRPTGSKPAAGKPAAASPKKAVGSSTPMPVKRTPKSTQPVSAAVEQSNEVELQKVDADACVDTVVPASQVQASEAEEVLMPQKEVPADQQPPSANEDQTEIEVADHPPPRIQDAVDLTEQEGVALALGTTALSPPTSPPVALAPHVEHKLHHEDRTSEEQLLVTAAEDSVECELQDQPQGMFSTAVESVPPVATSTDLFTLTSPTREAEVAVEKADEEINVDIDEGEEEDVERDNEEECGLEVSELHVAQAVENFPAKLADLDLDIEEMNVSPQGVAEKCEHGLLENVEGLYKQEELSSKGLANEPMNVLFQSDEMERNICEQVEEEELGMKVSEQNKTPPIDEFPGETSATEFQHPLSPDIENVNDYLEPLNQKMPAFLDDSESTLNLGDTSSREKDGELMDFPSYHSEPFKNAPLEMEEKDEELPVQVLEMGRTQPMEEYLAEDDNLASCTRSSPILSEDEENVNDGLQEALKQNERSLLDVLEPTSNLEKGNLMGMECKIRNAAGHHFETTSEIPPEEEEEAEEEEEEEEEETAAVFGTQTSEMSGYQPVAQYSAESNELATCTGFQNPQMDLEAIGRNDSQWETQEQRSPSLLMGAEKECNEEEFHLMGEEDVLVNAASYDFEPLQEAPQKQDEDKEEEVSQEDEMDVGSERAEEPCKVLDEEEDEDVEMASEGVTGLDSYGNENEEDFETDHRLDNLNQAPLLPPISSGPWDELSQLANQPADPPLQPWATSPLASCQPPWLDLRNAPQQEESFLPANKSFSLVEDEVPAVVAAVPQPGSLGTAELAAHCSSGSETGTPEELADYDSSSGVESRSEGKQRTPVPPAQPDIEQDLGIHLERGDGGEEEEEAETLPADEVLGDPPTAHTSAPSSPSTSGDEASDTEAEMQINDSDTHGIDNAAFDSKTGVQDLQGLDESGEDDGGTPQSAASVPSYAFDCPTSNAHSTAESCGKSPGLFSLENEEQLPEEAKDPSLVRELTLPAATAHADDLLGSHVDLLPLSHNEGYNKEEAEEEDEVEAEEDEDQYTLSGKPGLELPDNMSTAGPLEADLHLSPQHRLNPGDNADSQPPYFSTICDKTDNALAGRWKSQKQTEGIPQSMPVQRGWCWPLLPQRGSPRLGQLPMQNGSRHWLPNHNTGPNNLLFSNRKAQPNLQLRRLQHHLWKVQQIQQRQEEQKHLERLQHLKLEQERLERLQCLKLEQERPGRLQHLKVEQERLERLQCLKLEQERPGRLQHLKVEQERLERLQHLKLEQEHLERLQCLKLEKEELKRLKQQKLTVEPWWREKRQLQAQRRQDLLQLQLQHQLLEQEQHQRQLFLQWQQREQQQQQLWARTSTHLSPSSTLCTIYEAMETAEDDEEKEQDTSSVRSMLASAEQVLSPSLTQPLNGSLDTLPCPLLDLQWDNNNVNVIQHLINQSILLAGDYPPMLLLPGGVGGSLSPLETKLWPEVLPPLDPPTATVTSVSCFSPGGHGKYTQGDWMVIELETHH